MIAEALRLLRTRMGLTQAAAAKRQGAPDCRTLSFWENRRRVPSLHLLRRYLTSLDLDFRLWNPLRKRLLPRPERLVAGPNKEAPCAYRLGSAPETAVTSIRAASSRIPPIWHLGPGIQARLQNLRSQAFRHANETFALKPPSHDLAEC